MLEDLEHIHKTNYFKNQRRVVKTIYINENKIATPKLTIQLLGNYFIYYNKYRVIFDPKILNTGEH